MGLRERLNALFDTTEASGRQSWAVYTTVTLSAVGGAFAGGHPTGLDGLDPLLAAILAGGVTAFASRARPWSWAAAAGLATLASIPNGPLLLFAAAVYGAALVATLLHIGNRVMVGAALGALVVQILLRLPEAGPFGMQSLIAAVAVGIIAASGIRGSQASTRRTLLAAAAGVGGVVVAATALFGATALSVRSDLDDGISATRRGIDAARVGDTSEAAAAFDEARTRLSKASNALNAPWARVARVVPFVGQHEDALRSLTDDATLLTTTGAHAARQADLDTLRVENGQVDLARVASMRAPLDRVATALATTKRDLAEVDSGWLLGPVRDRLDTLVARVDKADGSARTALLGIEAAPALLGRDRPARYLLLFTTPAEARSSGFPGNWGVLTASDGTLDLTEFGRSDELNTGGDPSTRTITGPRDYLERYRDYFPELDWRNVTMSPDFPSVAKVATELAPQSGIGPVDGVFAIDPEGIAALLNLTGPITIPGRSEPLTAENAASFLLREQYTTPNPQRIDFLEEAAHAVTDKLTESSLPEPHTLGEVLGPAVKDGHIVLAASDDTIERFFRRLGADGALAPTEGDFVALTTQNASGNKIELFLDRSLRMSITLDPETGEERATATVILTNRAPTAGEPDYLIASPSPDVPTGTNRSIVSFYSSLTLEGATLGGSPVKLTGQIERDLNVYSTGVTIPSGGSVTLRLDLRGPARPVHGDTVGLTVGHQVMANPDEVEVTMHTTTGSLEPRPPLRAGKRGSVTWSGQLERRLTLRATVIG